ncbi:MAG TPA: Re/Si-specific NAD(P)(+) transhydrogenase subunit alpha [Gemmatimonadaceae bacterium]|nr:Re/Si-specific NAD(P)(+) transhydrogenase subunit alpha [Gemmatimonadaceae bacterium]
MQVAVLKETAPRESRVALTPDSAGRLIKLKVDVAVQQGAGEAAGFPDSAYVTAGCRIAPDAAAACAGARIVLKVQPPTDADLAAIPDGSLLISLLKPGSHGPVAQKLAAKKVSALALELVPRITRAQTMDVLSSQATVAGYKAVLLGAAELGKFLPMLTTAAGNIQPARVFVIGAGVAGLQAIATARRLGAVVSAFDIRPAAREQILSLGANAIATRSPSAEAETAGGYARVQTDDEHQQTVHTIAQHIKDVDLVISTANIPGRKAPVLILEDALATMRPGSVIVDLAAENGGNTAVTRAGETVHAHGVTVIGLLNLPATVPFHASQMFARNVLSLLQHLISKEGELVVSPTDEITGAMLVTHDGEVIR